MEKTFRLTQRLFTLLFIAALFMACGSDGDTTDDNGNPKPNTSVSDPTGTISLSMMKGSSGTATKMGSIYIGDDYNFSGADFVSLGTVKGLGNVSYIPTTGWAYNVSASKKHGYVAYSDGAFYRIFVGDEIVGTTGGVIGYDVKYQSPFKGKDAELDVPATSVSFTKEGGTENIVFNNKDLVVFTAKSSESWCQVLTTSTYDKYFLANGIQIIAQPSNTAGTTEATVTLTTAYGKKKEIKVTRAGNEPYLELSQTSVDMAAKKSSQTVGINTNILKENLEIQNTASSWLTAEISDQTRAIHAKAAKIKFVGNKAIAGPARAAALTSASSANYYTISLKASANDKESVRKGTITLKSKDGKKSTTLNVTQKEGYLYVYNLTDNTYKIGSNNGTATIQINTNISHEDLLANSSATWCKINGITADYWNMIHMNIGTENNETDKARDAKIEISNKTKTMTYTFTLRQEGLRFTPLQRRVGFDKKQSNKTITIYTDIDWEASSNQSWCTVTRNGNNLTIRATAYTGSAASRKATISFKGLSTKIEVDQSKYAVGDEYNENGVKGEVAYMNDTIRYVKKEVGPFVWSTERVLTGADDLNDGLKNMTVIKKISGWKELYPAFAACDALNTGNVTGWYLPAYEETQRINSKTTCWSSTESNSDNARTNVYGYDGYKSKNSGYYVIAIYRF